MAQNKKSALVLMSDFGLKERFVASMKGVAYGVDDDLQIYDLTHFIEPFNIWQGAFTLAGTIKYWPEGTVFVSVVDPGVGTNRKSVVLKTKSGHYIVTPDNGTLTLVAEQYGIEALREIDEKVNRLPASEDSYTFHGRDVYVYTGARLASGVITFEEVGPELPSKVVRLPYQKAKKANDSTIVCSIINIEDPFGNVVTNIPRDLLESLGLKPDEQSLLEVVITHKGKQIFKESIPYVFSFGYVAEGKPLLYPDSMQMIGLAVNNGSFAELYNIKAGSEWAVTVSMKE